MINLENSLHGDWKHYSHLFQTRQVGIKTVLINEGEVSKEAYYIERGCLRMWFNHEGKDITFQFFFEGQGVSSFESFRCGQPSLFTLEALEPCSLLVIPKNDFTSILELSPALRNDMEEHTFRRLLSYQKLFLSRIKDNPQRRYEALLNEHPQILQRVPQHYIASYLGITPVSLSRIRNRRT